MLERYVRKYLVRGRESSGYIARRQDMVDDIVLQLMSAMDVDDDGVVSVGDFMAWSSTNNLLTLVDDFYEERITSEAEERILSEGCHPEAVAL